MELKTGKYATMKDGRTIYITKVMESGTEFAGTVVSHEGPQEVMASVNEIDHIAKSKAIMHMA